MITADRRVPPPPTITPLLVAELLAEGERMPVYVHVIDHPDARVPVDTGMTELHAETAGRLASGSVMRGGGARRWRST
jgi:hypothetical protein